MKNGSERIFAPAILVAISLGAMPTSAHAAPGRNTQWNAGEITAACSGGDVGKGFISPDGRFYEFDIDSMNWARDESAIRIDKDLVRVKRDTNTGFYIYATKEWLEKVCKYDGKGY